jgi:hypothetical protein
MILIKDNGKTTAISIQKPFDFSSSYYTILLQNTVTKEIHQYTTEDLYYNKLYWNFQLNTDDLITGEYYVLLLANPQQLHLELSYNNINNIKEDERIKRILKNKGDVITNDMFILVNEETENPTLLFLMNKGQVITNGDIYIANTEESNIKILTKELLKVGEYKTPTTQYNKEKKFITYNGQ